MPRAAHLTKAEKAAGFAHHRNGHSLRSMFGIVKRSPSAMHRVIKRGNVVSGPRKPGPTPVLSELTRRFLLRRARTGMFSARDHRDEFVPALSVRRVQQILAADPTLRYVRMRRAPNLTPLHVQNRLAWARRQLANGASIWRRTVFSDEKRFSLDGPDGADSDWHYLRHERRMQGRRQQGGGGLMVWGCFSYRGKGKLVFVDNKIDSVRYTEVLQESFLPFIEDKHPEGAIFQQDGAPSHTSKHTKEWRMDNVVSDLEWPSKFPDMNTLENVWGYLFRVVYKDGRQYDTF